MSLVDRETGEIVSSPTPYQLMPGLTDEERASLRLDIEKHGIRVPIDVDENDNILDGHHRAWIAAELNIPCPRRVVAGLSEEEKRAHAVSVNVFRRNLTREQRRDLVARLRSEGMNVRRIAEATGTSVGTVMSDLTSEDVFSSEHVAPETITDTLGRKQPARRSIKEKIEEAKAKHPVADPPPQSRAAIEARVAKAKQMAADGYTSRQIGEALGIANMNEFRDRHGVDVPADRVVGKTRIIDANRVVTQTVTALEGAVMGIALVDLTQLDPEQIEGWVDSLSNSLRSLNRFTKQLKETTHG